MALSLQAHEIQMLQIYGDAIKKSNSLIAGLRSNENATEHWIQIVLMAILIAISKSREPPVL